MGAATVAMGTPNLNFERPDFSHVFLRGSAFRIAEAGKGEPTPS